MEKDRAKVAKRVGKMGQRYRTWARELEKEVDRDA